VGDFGESKERSKCRTGMHETAAALREWHARLLSWEAAQTDPGRVAEPSGASELRVLCKLLFDSAAKTLEWQTKRRCLGRRAAALRSTLGELKRLSIAGFDLEQVWAELEIRNRSLCAAARKTLERIESEFATGGGSAQCIEVASTADTAPSQDNGTLKRVRFDDERNETREFVRDQDEEVGCMSPNFFFDDDDDDDGNDNDEFIIGHAILEARDTMYDAGSSTSDSSERDEMDEATRGDFGANVGHEALRKFGHTSADMELNSLAPDAAASVKRRALSTNAASVADESAPDCLLSDESDEQGPGHSDTCDNAIESAHNVAAPEANTAGASASGSEAQSLPQHSNANNRSEALPSHVAQLDPWIEQTPEASWSSAESPTASIDNIDDASLDSFGTDDDSGTLESSASPEDDVYYEQFFGSEASDSLRSDASPREQSFPHRKRNQYTNATMDTKSQPAENRHDSKHNAHKLSTAAPTLDNTSRCTPVTTPEPAQTSAFERCEALLRTRARSLEKFNLEEKPWQLRGEVTGHERPVDSVLDAELDFDLSVARRPRIRTHAYEAALAGNHVDEAAISDRAADSDTDTSQDTDTHVLTEASIRRRVLQRVLDQAFDDVQRRVRPSTADAAAAAAAPDAGAFELSQERSAQGLAELYAGRDAATAGAQGIVRGASTQTPKSPRNPLEQQVDALFGELASAIATQTEVAERVLETRSFAVADGWSLRPQKLVSDATQTVAVGEAPWMLLGRGDVPGAEAAALAEQRVARDPVREQASRLGVDTDASLRLKQGDTEASRSSRRTRRNRLKRLVRSRLRRKRETAEQRQRATEWLQEAALRDSIAAWEAKSRGRSRHESRIAGETDRDQQVVYEQALRVVQQAQAQADAQARAHVSRGQYAGIRIRKAEHVAEQPARGSTDPAHTSSIQCGGARRTRRLEPGDDHVQAGGGSGSATLYLQLRRQLDREIQRQKTSSL